MELHQDGAIPITATAVFARRRDVPAPGHYAPIDRRDLPAWVANHDIRAISGGMSFHADARPDRGWPARTFAPHRGRPRQ